MKKTEERKKNEIRPGMQVEFICPRCGTHLAWALPNMELNCPKCGNWVTNQNRKKPDLDLNQNRKKPDLDLMLPTDDDQLTLF